MWVYAYITHCSNIGRGVSPDSMQTYIIHAKFAPWSPMPSGFCDSVSLCNFSLSSARFNHFLFVIVLLIGTSQGVVAACKIGMWQSKAPTHLSFFCSGLCGRHRFLWCANDPVVCLDRKKNPWGGSTCCFQQFCKDTLSDVNHCGACGRVCGHGLVCCDGKCVDIQNDPHNCGSCFQECPGQNGCSYAMCEYSGWLISFPVLKDHISFQDLPLNSHFVLFDIDVELISSGSILWASVGLQCLFLLEEWSVMVNHGLPQSAS